AAAGGARGVDEVAGGRGQAQVEQRRTYGVGGGEVGVQGHVRIHLGDGHDACVHLGLGVSVDPSRGVLLEAGREDVARGEKGGLAHRYVREVVQGGQPVLQLLEAIAVPGGGRIGG